jgi:hypothetical protein
MVAMVTIASFCRIGLSRNRSMLARRPLPTCTDGGFQSAPRFSAADPRTRLKQPEETLRKRETVRKLMFNRSLRSRFGVGDLRNQRPNEPRP